MTITASFSFSYRESSAAACFLRGCTPVNMGVTHHIRDDSGQQEVLLVLMRALL